MALLVDPSTLQFPAALQCLFIPKRMKVLWGGRGAGRSWGCARALLLVGMQKPVRVLCVREFQNSIEESVHKVLSDQIRALGWEGFYDIQKAKIIGINGTTFSFEGIKNNTNRIKSYEGIDYCWVEEGVKVSKASWGVLIPTIRKESSEIWVTFNPELDTDYTYQRWVKDPSLELAPPTRFGSPLDCPIYESESSFVCKMTYKENRWFPQVLRDEMLRDKERDYDYYLNVWEGHTLQMLEGVVYAKELRKAQEEQRICSVPWAKEVPVDTFWDLGRADNTAIWFSQRVGMQTRVLEYYEASGEDITHFLDVLQSRKYLYNLHWLPHDAKAQRLGSKKSIQEVVQGNYPGRVRIVPKLSVVDGINAARLVFGQCYFDEAKCEDGLHALRHYRYQVKDGQLSKGPLHDWASDGADAFRYMAVAMKNRSEGPSAADPMQRIKQKVSKWVSEAPGLGWMGQ